MKCEIIGDVGKPTDSPKQCDQFAKFAVSVEGLSPLKCCKFHKNEMVKFWGVCYEVTVNPLNQQ
jgi:hypothetical protein